MALRVLLVGLVASMGFELPSGQDVESWTRNGSRWVNARMTDLSSLRAEAERAFVGEPLPEIERIAETTPPDATKLVSIRDDLTFDAVVDGMATTFVSDLASIEAPKPVEQVVAEAPKPVEPVVAVVEPSNETSQIPCVDPDTEITEIVVVEKECPETCPVTTVEVDSKPDKLSEAVRLTRDAVNAWASLIQPSTDRAADQDQEDAF